MPKEFQLHPTFSLLPFTTMNFERCQHNSFQFQSRETPINLSLEKHTLLSNCKMLLFFSCTWSHKNYHVQFKASELNMILDKEELLTLSEPHSSKVHGSKSSIAAYLYRMAIFYYFISKFISVIHRLENKHRLK